MFNDHFIPGEKIIQPLHKKGNMKIKKRPFFFANSEKYIKKKNQM